MTKARMVKVNVLSVSRDDFPMEPFETLVKEVNAAWTLVPEPYLENAQCIIDFNGITAWYERPETDHDRREREEYERLKARLS
jgi:hypothetical protein